MMTREIKEVAEEVEEVVGRIGISKEIEVTAVKEAVEAIATSRKTGGVARAESVNITTISLLKKPKI